MVYEIVEQMNGEVPDAIVCCVGGGGLIGGIFKGTMTSKYQTDFRSSNSGQAGLERWYIPALVKANCSQWV